MAWRDENAYDNAAAVNAPRAGFVFDDGCGAGRISLHSLLPQKALIFAAFDGGWPVADGLPP